MSTSESPVYIVYITCANPEEATRIGRSLVNARLAACVNILGEIRSIYRWNDQLADEPEVLCLAKTTADRLEALRERVIELHHYEVPEVIAVPVAAGHLPYLAWVRENTAD